MKTNYNNKIAFYCRKLKKASLFEKCYSRNGVVHLVTKNSTGDAIFNAPLVKKLMERLQIFFFFFLLF